jgi:AGZA family xanthine/uracil permease-like MFS transporter
LQSFFVFEKYQTSFRQETLAGITMFLTVANIIIVYPAILENAGMPRGPQVTATILAAVIGTTIMAFWAKHPFAIAPYMGENAFVTFVVVKTMGSNWQTALAAVIF